MEGSYNFLGIQEKNSRLTGHKRKKTWEGKTNWIKRLEIETDILKGVRERCQIIESIQKTGALKVYKAWECKILPTIGNGIYNPLH